MIVPKKWKIWLGWFFYKHILLSVAIFFMDIVCLAIFVTGFMSISPRNSLSGWPQHISILFIVLSVYFLFLLIFYGDPSKNYKLIIDWAKKNLGKNSLDDIVILDLIEETKITKDPNMLYSRLVKLLTIREAVDEIKKLEEELQFIQTETIPDIESKIGKQQYIILKNGGKLFSN